jgi:hypothetical protein
MYRSKSNTVRKHKWTQYILGLVFFLWLFAKNQKKFQNNLNVKKLVVMNDEEFYKILKEKVSKFKKPGLWILASIITLLCIIYFVPNWILGNKSLIGSWFHNNFKLDNYAGYMSSVQSVASVFALIGVFLAALSYKSQKDLQIKTLEGDNKPILTILSISRINTKETGAIFTESFTKITDFHGKKVFDIHPADKRGLHPLFIIKNTGKNYARNIRITVYGGCINDNKIEFTSSDSIDETPVSILEADKWFFIRKDEKYKSSSFNFEEDFAIQVKYNFEILNKEYTDQYRAIVKCRVMTFVIKTNGNECNSIKDKLIYIGMDDYDLLSRLWKKHNEEHRIRDCFSYEGRLYKYLEIKPSETDVFEDKYYETESSVTNGKTINKYIFIQKKGAYIDSFTKIL